MTTRVLLVDDQQLVRTGFRMILEDEPDIEVVGEAADGQAGSRWPRRLRPDVVVMDIRMPVMDGSRRPGAWSVRGPDAGVRVLVLTTFDADETSSRPSGQAPAGSSSRTSPPADFVAAIRTIAAGDALLAPSVTRQLLDRFRDRLPPVGPGAERRAPRADRSRDWRS